MASLQSTRSLFNVPLRARRTLWLAALFVLALTAGAAAQFGFRGGYLREPNVSYDGRFTFTRLRYHPNSAWNHDYPRADRHLVRILKELTSMEANVDGSNVLDLDAADLFKFPIAYMSEPGYWRMTDAEAFNLRQYLLKGGFLIFDDFEKEQWNKDRKSTRLNSSHIQKSRMPSSA